MKEKLETNTSDDAGWIEQYTGKPLPASAIPKTEGKGKTLDGRTYILGIPVPGFVSRGGKILRHPMQDEIKVED